MRPNEPRCQGRILGGCQGVHSPPPSDKQHWPPAALFRTSLSSFGPRKEMFV